MLENCARWIAEEAAYFGIPVSRLTPTQAQGSGRGVCQHSDLGAWGGGHWDCGGSFPMDKVLSLAKSQGGDTSDMGYPQWYWDWSLWYLTSNRDPATRPKDAPQTIPQWAWDGNDEQLRLLNRFGMTQPERDWIVWYNGGKKGTRPSDAPQDIPDPWWQDQSWALAAK